MHDEHSQEPGQEPSQEPGHGSDQEAGADSGLETAMDPGQDLGHDFAHEPQLIEQAPDAMETPVLSEPELELEAMLITEEMVITQERVSEQPIAYQEPEPEPQPEIELEPLFQPEAAHQIPVAEPAPLVSQPKASEANPVGGAAQELLGLPLQFLSQLLQKLGAAKLESLTDLIPAARLVAIALLAGVALKITGASLDAINEIPLVGGLLELVGLVSLLNFLSRNALKAQKRAELLSRIRKLKQDFFG